MTDARPFGLADVVLFLAVLLAAAGARAGYLVACDDRGRAAAPVRVQGEAAERDSLVAGLRDRGTFATRAPFADAEEETAHVAPGYPWLLGLLARLPVDQAATARWIQCGLGALTAGLYFLFARRAFRSRLVATLAGFACAAYPFWVVNTAELSDGVLATFLLAACLFLGARAGGVGGSFTSLLYGLALAGAALVRAALLPFAFIGLLWFLLRARTMPRGWLLALLAFLGFANGLAPWLLHNVQVQHDVVPVVDSAYLHLWMGNNPQATGGPMDEPAMLKALAEQRGETPEEAARRLAELPQRRRYASLAGAVVEEVRSDPAATVRRRLRAGLYFVFGERWFQNGELWVLNQPPEAGTPLAAVPVTLTASLLALLVLGVLGWRWTYGWRVASMPAALAVIWVPLPYLLSHAELLQGPRLPLDGVFLCYAAFSAAYLLTAGRLGRGERAGPR